MVREDGSTNVSGLYVVGDLSGIPLLKLSANSGTRSVRRIARELGGSRTAGDDGGLRRRDRGRRHERFRRRARGRAARPALCRARGQRAVLDHRELSPRGKPIYKYPTELRSRASSSSTTRATSRRDCSRTCASRPSIAAWAGSARACPTSSGGAVFSRSSCPAGSNRPRAARPGRRRARRGHSACAPAASSSPSVAAATTASSACPARSCDKVYNRLHDPKDYAGQQVLVVGGGDSALGDGDRAAPVRRRRRDAELPQAGVRPSQARQHASKIQRAGQATPAPTSRSRSPHDPSASTTASAHTWRARRQARPIAPDAALEVKEIRDEDGRSLDDAGRRQTVTLPNDVVFVDDRPRGAARFLPPLAAIAILRRARGASAGSASAPFFAFCVFLYHWKSRRPTAAHRTGSSTWHAGRFPFNSGVAGRSLGGVRRPRTLLGTLGDHARRAAASTIRLRTACASCCSGSSASGGARRRT